MPLGCRMGTTKRRGTTLIGHVLITGHGSFLGATSNQLLFFLGLRGALGGFLASGKAFGVLRHNGRSGPLQESAYPTGRRGLDGGGTVLGLVADNESFIVTQNHGVIRCRDQVIGHKRYLAATMRAINHIGGNAKARHMAPEPLHEFDPLPNTGSEVAGTNDRITMKEVIGANLDAQKPPEKAAHGCQIVIDALEQHRVVVDRHPATQQKLDTLGCFGGDFTRMVKVGLDPDLAHRRNQLDQRFVIKPHGKRHGHPGPDADDVHMRDGRQAFEKKPKLGNGERQRITTREDHIPNFGMVPDILHHPLIITTDGFPPTSNHGGPFAGTEATIHGTNMG